jgi:D-3-phosphoglycerate dehydrogenase
MVQRGWVLFTDTDHTFEEADLVSFEALGAPLLKVRGSDEFLAASPKALAVLNSGFPLTSDLINTLEMCRVISRFGSGYDNIDIEAAARKGIPVCNVPVFCVSEVANRTVTLLLACSSHLLLLDRAARNGVWGVHNLPHSRELEGEALGLLGFGKIGRAVATRARAFGLRVVAHDPYVSPDAMSAEGVQAMALDELLADVDYVSIHVPV